LLPLLFAQLRRKQCAQIFLELALEIPFKICGIRQRLWANRLLVTQTLPQDAAILARVPRIQQGFVDPTKLYPYFAFISPLLEVEDYLLLRKLVAIKHMLNEVKSNPIS
jgi:hypothetical protein